MCEFSFFEFVDLYKLLFNMSSSLHLFSISHTASLYVCFSLVLSNEATKFILKSYEVSMFNISLFFIICYTFFIIYPDSLSVQSLFMVTFCESGDVISTTKPFLVLGGFLSHGSLYVTHPS